MRLAGHTAFVTGAAGLLGRAIVADLRREGAKVVASDINAEGLAAMVATADADGPSLAAVIGDVTDENHVERMVDEAERLAGPVDILVNCAGKYLNQPVVAMTVEEWDRAMALNLRSTMLMCRAYGRRWIAAKTRGVIVNISSGAGTSARAGSAHYAAAKAGVNMLTQVLAIEFGREGIRVNGVAPGVVLDHVVEEESPDNHAYINLSLRGIPLGRTGRPDDIAQAVSFLASDGAEWINGVTLEVNGGSHCGRTHVPLTFDANFK
ncbi:MULTISPECIES: SDR family oxidoreductase [unclassified Chelatococcus]|uniref:SDR family NAD(P)-dependent oxidoreductase n=1 Tax=unclassified Chelatococcus TaxID=2638111 RepID=UPI001BD045DA|nr:MULTISPECIES: SDR family oxidoreductase [unclassified Chelatococcus]MBS7697190.1 SDR family oxidoreductase [Chelatococcus sp. YT9]MBX3556513.1 SDR family oxidoreductase [Chelatococcus sp.]